MIEALGSIEWDASRRSVVHRLDARVKIILVFLMIILVAGYPIRDGILVLAIPFAGSIGAAWILSGLSVRTYAGRLLMTLPFGVFIIFFQIFFKNPHTAHSTLISLPSPLTWIPVYTESVEAASLLFVKFILCISAIILLSSTTPVQEMLRAGKRLGLPPVMALSLGMMIRYLYLFSSMYSQINHALQNRNFDPFDRRLSYLYRLRTLGYAMGVLFLRAYEQGERTYCTMVCRGYGVHALEQVQRTPLQPRDTLVLALMGIMMPMVTLAVFYYTG